MGKHQMLRPCVSLFLASMKEEKEIQNVTSPHEEAKKRKNEIKREKKKKREREMWDCYGGVKDEVCQWANV